MRRKIFLLVLAISYILTGCVSTGNDLHPTEDAISSQVQTDPQVEKESDGVLKLSMRTTQTLHPLYNEDESVAQILLLLYRPLISIDEKGKPVPSVAQSWFFDEDGRVLILNLRDDIYWQDGNQLSSVDVVYSVNELKNASENAVYKGCVEHIVSCSAPDNQTVKITFDERYTGNIYAACFPIVERAAFSRLTESEKIANLSAVGSGLYQLESYTPARNLTLTRYNDCFLGRAEIEKISVEIIQDEETELYSFDQGLIDAVSTTESTLGKFDIDSNGQKAEYVMNYFDFIGFNFQRDLFQDINVRRAINYVVPRKEILNNIYLNHAVHAVVPVNPSSWLYAEDLTVPEPQSNNAKKLLDQSGWKYDSSNKLRYKDGDGTQPLKASILVNKENEERRQTAIYLADELKFLGFDVQVEEVAFDEYQRRLEEGEYDLYIGGWKMSVDPDLRFFLGSGGYGNYSGYESDMMESLLAEAASATEETSIKQAYVALEKFIVSEIPCITIAYRKAAVYNTDDVEGSLSPVENEIFRGIENWKLK